MASCDAQFGPRVNTACRSFDFTLYFEDVVFGIATNAAFILCSILPCISLIKRRKLIKSSLLFGLKMTVFSILVILQAIFLALRVKHSRLHTDASVAADVLSLVATLVASALSWLQHHRSEQPSTLLVLYLSALSILNIASVRTIYFIPGNSAAFSVKLVVLLLTAAATVLESTGKRASLYQPEKLAHSGPEPFLGVWNLTGYTWVLNTLIRGYRNLLSVDDLPDLDYRIAADKLHHQLETQLKKADLRKKNAFFFACMRAFPWPLAQAIVPRLCLIGFKFAQPFLINHALDFIGDRSSPQNIGNGLIAAYGLVYVGMAISTVLYRYYHNRFIISLRGALISVIYQQSVDARALDLGDIDGLTIMGTDVERISISFRSMHELWANPIEFAIAVYLLERKIFLACIVPGLLVFVFVLIGFGVASLSKKYQRAWIEKVEERLKLTTNMLANMRTVKMLGLSPRMFDLVFGARDTEIKHSTRYRWALIAQVWFSNSLNVLPPVVTFVVFVAMSQARHDNTFLAAKAFTSLSLISLITDPAMMFIQIIANVWQCMSCFDRMQEYCRQPVHPGLVPKAQDNDLATEKGSSDISLQQLPQETSGDSSTSAVEFIDQDCAWAKSGAPVLKKLNGSIRKGRFTAVVGRTGSGKSTLLDSILGETVGLGGRTQRNFSTAAYCSQIPWLVNGTLRYNVTYGASDPIDEQWYDTVIDACGLENDIRTLPGGDLTEIGDGGSKLSGGQRQRVSLARGVFSHEQVILLDDVFSGLDNGTIAHISEKLFGANGLLRRNGITVILVTHSNYLMMMADDVLVLDKGTIVESRTVSSIKSSGFSSGFQIEEAATSADDEEATKLTPASTNALARVETAEEHLSALNEEAADLKRQQGTPSVYRYYSKSSGYVWTVVFIVGGALYIVSLEFGIVWIDIWSSAVARDPVHVNNGLYLGVYAALGVLSPIMLFLLCWMLFITMISASSRNLHTDLLTAVVRAPLLFFQETDIGRITNRFSQDMELIAIELPIIVVNYVCAFFECLAKLILLGVFGRYLTAALPIFLALVYIIQHIYLRTSRQVRLIDIEAKAPVYLQFLESKNGASTLRAFGWQDKSKLELQKKLDWSQKPVYLLYSIQQWLTFVLDSVVAALVLLLIAIVVTWRDKFSPGAVGVSLVTVMTFNFALSQLIRMWTALETSIGAIARIKSFKDNTIPEEEELGILQPESAPPNWPSAGNIDFKNAVASYKETGPLALKGLTLSIKAGEKVAICGRSGSGKTSLILSLLHMIHINGEVLIDGIDIHNIVPNELRSLINIVPQEPFLMPGSVRRNVDPFAAAEDDVIIAALKRLNLWERIESMGGIDAEMPLTSWSVGERQLICMARAMVRKSPILILDEATSSVDHKTEEIMQEVLETDFAGQTVLSVVHRLGYIDRYDKVAVLQRGELMEFDAPATLLAQPSILAAMKRAGTRGSDNSSVDS